MARWLLVCGSFPLSFLSIELRSDDSAFEEHFIYLCLAAFAKCFGSLCICSVKRFPTSLTETIALYTVEFFLLLLPGVTLFNLMSELGSLLKVFSHKGPGIFSDT